MPDATAHPAYRFDPWSQLWSQTARSSWDLMADDPIALALREHWQAQAPWIHACSHVVDVGSGPAVLARLLAPPPPSGPLSTDQVKWTCVDQAEIPASAVADLHFVAPMFGERWEFLPVPQGIPTALISNFGLEYVSRDGLAPTCAAWLQQGCRLHVVLHARGSLIEQISVQSAADLDLVLDELDFPRHLGALLEAKAAAPADPVDRMMHGVEERDSFNVCVNHMKRVLDERGLKQGPLLEWLMLSRELVHSVPEVTLESAFGRLEALRAAYDAERSRLTAMRSSAMDLAELEALGREMASAGFGSIQLGTLRASTGAVAWVLDALRVQGSQHHDGYPGDRLSL